MAASKNLLSTALTMEVENGTDTNGNPKYTKKSFKGVKANATVDNILAVALKIKSAFNGGRSIQLQETHAIVSE